MILRKNITTIFFLLIVVSACIIPESVVSNPSFEVIQEGYFSINIQNEIGTNSKRKIELIPISKQEIIDHNLLPLLLDENDFGEIEEIVRKEIWPDRANNMQLFDVVYTSNCINIYRGFQKGGFTYFTLDKIDNEDIGRRTEYNIQIKSNEGIVYWYESELSVNNKGEDFIDLTKYQVQAYAAVQKAELFGGNEKRIQVNNYCIINASTLGNNRNAWFIQYISTKEENPGTIFSIDVEK